MRAICFLGLATLGLVLLPALRIARAQGITIDHKVVGCVVAERYPKIEAQFDPADTVARARVYFRAKGTPNWYFVDMHAEARVFAGVLPKPKKSLHALDYYVEVSDRAFAASRTSEFEADVVEPPGACGKGLPTAAAMSSAKAIVGAASGAPPIPPGFSASGVVSASAGTTAGAAGSGAGTASVGVAAGAGAAAGAGHTTAIVLGVVGAGAAAGGIVAATHNSSPTTLPRITTPISGHTTTIGNGGCYTGTDGYALLNVGGAGPIDATVQVAGTGAQYTWCFCIGTGNPALGTGGTGINLSGGLGPCPNPAPSCVSAGSGGIITAHADAAGQGAIFFDLTCRAIPAGPVFTASFSGTCTHP